MTVRGWVAVATHITVSLLFTQLVVTLEMTIFKSLRDSQVLSFMNASWEIGPHQWTLMLRSCSESMALSAKRRFISQQQLK